MEIHARKIPWTMELAITQPFFELETQDFVWTILIKWTSMKCKISIESMQKNNHMQSMQQKISKIFKIIKFPKFAIVTILTFLIKNFASNWSLVYGLNSISSLTSNT